ncbi:MAG: ExbD/TolR family protein [Candidatus Rifleibacteriota bacterium]
MALRRKKNINGSSFLDLTGASDIIFTLLLFYILTQNFLPAMRVDLPEMTNNEPKQSENAQIICIKPDSTITYNDQEFDIQQLKSQPQKLLKVLNKKNPVIIRVDKSSRSGTMISLMDIFARSGLSSIDFQGIPYVEP